MSIGPVIDRFGPVSSFVALILFLGLGSFAIALGGSSWVIFLYFALMGIGLGMSGPVMNVIWPNLYGTQHIGSIKGFVGMFRNGLTSLGPLPIALAIDHHLSLSSLLLWMAIIISILTLLPVIISIFNPRIYGVKRLS